ncbi:CBO0543 family protein [Halobacillus sp. HZG1]|uniref:CBO0543 family protein n=1 Tax=Halobacillus sp. HZG1 TaxID=3111769 RepID=UPI002DB641AB|nr:CBO0543 family protein [Halobacillus sp. HZG1]MEC3885573.1 CBO0543 family protein [Halobacillus sp. HZG1]
MGIIDSLEWWEMYLLLVIVVWVLFAYRFVDWKQVGKQYPTILFFIAVNMTYNFLYYNHTLWAFRGITMEWLNHSIINMAFTFFICPVGLIIYLQRFPQTRSSQFIYITVWVAFYTVLEWLFSLKGMYVYDHGWNNWLNIPLNAVLFGVLYLHYRNPVRALLVSVPIIVLFYAFFPFPLDSLK